MPMVSERVATGGEVSGWRPAIGAWPDASGTHFRVWAPDANHVEVVAERPDGRQEVFPLEKAEDGTFGGLVGEIRVGDRYRYRVDGKGPFPDPASRFQPEGVHGPSQVVDPTTYAWTDAEWRGVPPEEVVIYELHVGTFSPEGTFDGAINRLPELGELGVTAIELLPLADFAGSRSWGYDGVDLFAPARCYGSPDDLRRLVDEAHRLGMSVFLDVVYNHFGPVGNYALAFSPHYLSQRSSAWAACVNLDGEHGGMVREFFIENALHWVHEYHMDGLRLDATHALFDEGPRHFLAELSSRVHESVPGRRILLIAEDHRNLSRMLRPEWAGGWDLDGVWADDFHHQMRRLLAGDNEAYYRDFSGTIPDLVETLNQGWYFTGQQSIHLDEPRGTDPTGIEPRKFVICLQNHDQVGNRAFGDRLNQGIDPAAYRVATAVLLTAPQTPMLFMGQEWAATAPFLYFTDHDEDLGKIVTEGRRREFRHFLAFAAPDAREKIPDPQAPSTFEASRLDWSQREREPHLSTLRLHQALLHLRREEPALRAAEAGSFQAVALGADTLAMRRRAPDGSEILGIYRLHGEGEIHLGDLIEPGSRAEVILTTEDPRFAPIPMPPEVELSGERPTILFRRPSAVLLRVSPANDGQAAPQY